MQIVTRSYLKPSLSITGTILRAIKVHKGRGIVSLTLRSNCCSSSGIPGSYHSTILIKAIFLAIDSFVGKILFSACFLLTRRLEIEPTILLLIPILITRLSLFVIVVDNIQQSPANGHSAIIFIAKVVLTSHPSIIISLTLTITYPTIQHSSFCIKSIFFAIDNFS